MPKVRSLDDKLNAAMAYVLTGFSDQASKICGIPERTISGWVRTEWFQALIAEARSQKQEQLDGQWTGMVHAATTAMMERIQKGDAVLDARTKEVHYVPVKLKDLAIATAIITDKRSLLRGQATSRVEKISTDQRLDKIQEKLGKATVIDEAINED